MFKSIAKVLKSFASFVFWIGSITSLLFGLSFVTAGSGLDASSTTGIVIIILGVLGSYISACIIYGLGELISNTAKTNKLLEMLLEEE